MAKIGAVALVLLVLLGLPRAALAHEGAPPEPHDIWEAWSWEPPVVLGLALAGWAYARGVRALWRRAGRGRGVRPWQAVAFGSGLAALFVALVSPLDALGSALFSAHMAQHLVLILVAAPLLVVGAPPVLFLWALPEATRRAVGRWYRRAWALRAAWHALSHPITVWALHAVAVWVWHLPSLYQAALSDEAVHVAEHASFLGTAILFWWVVLGQGHGRGLDRGLGVLYLFTTAMQGGILGALMTFSPVPWYPAYETTVAAWGLTPIEDQQLAGLLMWVPSGLVYTVAALALFAAWLQHAERSAHPADCGSGVGLGQVSK
jgi:putative membrane protein